MNGLTWDDAEPIPAACGVGPTGNRWVEVQPSDTAFELSYCWERCASCQLTSVMFRVDMGETPVHPAGVHVAGDFQGWQGNTTPMADADGDGIWEVTLELTRNTTYSFKFANDGFYEFHDIDFDCDIFDESAYHNRFVATGGVGSSVVYTGCFDNCDGAAEPHLNCAGECLMDADGDGICDPLDISECTDEATCNTGDWASGENPCIYPLVAGDCGAGAAACGEGLIWNESSQTCEITLAMDGNFDGCVGTADLLMMLGQFGVCLE